MSFVLNFAVIFIIFFVLGAFWYSPIGFAKAWVKANNIDLKNISKQGAKKAMALSFAFRLVQISAFVLLLNALSDLSILYIFLLIVIVSSISIFDNIIWKTRSFKAVFIDFSYFSSATLLSVIAFKLLA